MSPIKMKFDVEESTVYVETLDFFNQIWRYMGTVWAYLLGDSYTTVRIYRGFRAGFIL